MENLFRVLGAFLIGYFCISGYLLIVNAIYESDNVEPVWIILGHIINAAMWLLIASFLCTLIL